MVVVWRTIAWHYDPTQTTAQYEIAYHVLNADGSFAGPDGILTGFAAQSQTNPEITELSNGKIVVSWDTVAEVDPDVGPTADINHAVFDVGSEGALTSIRPTQTSNTNIVSTQRSSDIVALETGGYLMVWKSYDSDNSNPFSGNDIVLREFDANGDPTAPEQTLISGDNKYDHEPAFAGLPNGKIVVSWHNSNSNYNDNNYTDNGVSEIVMEVYDIMGHQIARHTVLMTDSDRRVARNVDIAVDPTTGGYMLVFEYFDYDQPNYNLDIFAQKYDANGQPLAQPFKLHPDDSVDQSFAATTYLGDGTFVAAWRSKVNQGPGFFEM